MSKFIISLVVTTAALLAGLSAAMPAFAGVPVWRFDAQKNQLDLQLDTPVQPQAKLISNPSRLVIDLPGVRLGRKSFTEALNNPNFRSLRFGQVDPGTARVVVDLPLGYTIDPQQVRLNPIGARHWTVDLPQPIPIAPGMMLPVADIAIAVPMMPPEPIEASPTRKQRGRLLVVIDPGHGGRDPGAIGIGGIQEKNVTLDIGQKLAERLRRQGIDVVMTRDSDIELDLAPRVAIAERAKADFFVSIHANSINMSRPDVSGLETYYHHKNSALLADKIHGEVLQTTGIVDRRVRTARFYVIRNTSMPAVLLEVGFVTGAEDASRLADPAYRSRTADAIAAGILQTAGPSRLQTARP
jgi:N-acetylmuramoyl-L-alanine amidase